MARPALRLARVRIDHPDAMRLVAEVQQEYVVRYGGPDRSPIDVEEFAGDRGVFLVGYDDDVAVATGAWRRHEPVAGVSARDVAEIKRMYVAASHRRRGLARLVLAELERTALAAGVEALILETGLAQPEALALYADAGYRPVPGFGFHAGAPLSRCFAKELRAAPAGLRTTPAPGPVDRSSGS